jgi:hypothetical protein
MSLTLERTTHLPSVQATLHYLVPSAATPRTYTYDPPPGVRRSTATYAPYPVTIRNARSIADDLSLDGQGFELVDWRSAVRDFHDEAELRRVYYPESERLVAEATGADRVVIFDHTIRRRVPGAEDRASDAPRQPVPRVHVDHTERSGPQRVRDLLGGEAEALLRGRVQIINVWRPIRGPLRDAPLAVCDARSVSPRDLVPSELVYRNRVGETYGVTFNPDHRWYFAPDMTRDEALLLKCYDSLRDGRARFSPHTAFDDPTAPADVLPRESIELRTLVFHHA